MMLGVDMPAGEGCCRGEPRAAAAVSWNLQEIGGAS